MIFINYNLSKDLCQIYMTFKLFLCKLHSTSVFVKAIYEREFRVLIKHYPFVKNTNQVPTQLIQCLIINILSKSQEKYLIKHKIHERY